MIPSPLGMDVSPDGNHVAYTSKGMLFLAHIPGGEKEREAPLQVNQGANLAFSPDGERLGVSCLGGLEIWSARDLAFENRVRYPPRRVVFTAAASPDGRSFATSGSSPIYRWDPRTWTLRDSLMGHTTAVSSLTFSRDGRLIASSGSKTIIVWDPEAARPLWKRDSPRLLGPLAFSPDGRWLAVGAGRGSVMVLDARTGRTAREWTAHDENGIGAIAFSPDGHRLVTSGWREGIRLWDVDRLIGRAKLRSI